MSKLKIIAGLALASTLMAAPAFAGGKHTVVNKGPAPLKERFCTDGSKGYYDAQGRFICPAKRTVTPVRRVTPTPTYVPPRQVTRPAPAPVRTIPAPAPEPKFNLAGLTGGVGVGIGTGFVGGGNGLFIDNKRRFSGALDAPAAALLFNQRAAAVPAKPMPPHPCCGGNGGNGGGQGGNGGNGGGQGGMGGKG